MLILAPARDLITNLIIYEEILDAFCNVVGDYDSCHRADSTDNWCCDQL